MELVGTEIMDRLVPILNGAAVGGGQCRLQVELLRTLCAMAETDDYEEILRLQGAARYIADLKKELPGMVPGE